MPLYKNGKKLTSTQIKNYVKKVNNWSDAEYDKARYNIKNKLRTFEAYQRAAGKAEVKVQSPAEFLYREAQAKKRYGADYEPSIARKRIQEISGKGNAKAIEAYLKGKGGETIKANYQSKTEQAFAKLMAVDKTAAEIWDKLKDNPVKAEEALAAYAKALHTYQDAQGKVSGGGIPFGEAMGYSIAFDYSAYL